MGITKEITEDETIRSATQRGNVMAIGWDPAHDNDMTVFSIGVNVFRQMAGGDMGKELELTASMMSVLAERQAAAIAESRSDMAKTDSVTS